MSDQAKKFIELPSINPKTNEPPVHYVCTVCGSLVVSRKKHLQWHKNVDSNSSMSSYPFWEGVDDL